MPWLVITINFLGTRISCEMVALDMLVCVWGVILISLADVRRVIVTVGETIPLSGYPGLHEMKK